MSAKGFTIKGSAKTTGAVRNLASLTKEIDKLRGRVEKLDTKTERAGKTTEGWGKRLGAAKGKIVGYGVAIAGAAIALDSVIERSMKLQNVQQNMPYAIDKARKATRGLVDDFELSKLAIEANRLGVAKSEEDFARLAEAATKLGLSVGKDAASSVSDLVVGLGRGSTEVLDNLGVLVRANEEYARYAKTIHKTAGALTDAEKRQAVMTGGLDQATKKAAEMEINVDKTTRRWLELKTEMKNWADEVVPVVVAALGQIVGFFSQASREMETLVTNLTQSANLLDSITTTKTRGVVMDPYGSGGNSAIEEGRLARQRNDFHSRRADAALRSRMFGLVGRHGFTGTESPGGGGRVGGGRDTDPSAGLGGNARINAAEEAVVGALYGVAEALGVASGQKIQGLRNDARNMNERREQMLEDVRAFADRQFEIEAEAARRRDELREEELAKAQAHAEQLMGTATAMSDASIQIGGAAIKAAIMSGQGIRKTVQDTATAGAIDMGIQAALETARGIIAAASPLTAYLAPGHFAAAKTAAATAVFVGGIAGVAAMGGGGRRAGGPGGAGGFGGSSFAGGKNTKAGRRAPSQGGPITSSGIVQSQGSSSASKGGGNTYVANISTLGFADQDQMVGVMRKAFNRHEQTYGSAT